MFDRLPKAYAQNMQPVLSLCWARLSRLGIRKLQGDVSEMISREICWASRALVLHDCECDFNVNDTIGFTSGQSPDASNPSPAPK